jgi:hypothetical protein
VLTEGVLLTQTIKRFNSPASSWTGLVPPADPVPGRGVPEPPVASHDLTGSKPGRSALVRSPRVNSGQQRAGAVTRRSLKPKVASPDRWPRVWSRWTPRTWSASSTMPGSSAATPSRGAVRLLGPRQRPGRDRRLRHRCHRPASLNQPQARRAASHQCSRHKATLQEAGQRSSLPTLLPRALRALAHEAAVTEDEPHAVGKLGAVAPGRSVVVLASRSRPRPQGRLTGKQSGPAQPLTRSAATRAAQRVKSQAQTLFRNGVDSVNFALVARAG